jgi:molybdate transport system permease protein
MGNLAPFWLSIRVSLLATVLDVLVGIPLAWWLARSRFRGKSLVDGIVLLPLVLPPTVLGFVLLMLIGRRSWFGGWLEATTGFSLAFHWTGAVVASAVAAFPLFLLPVRSAFEGVDPRLEDAARLLGRNERAVFLEITIPLAWRGLIAGTSLAFARAMGDYGATLMVAGDIPNLTQTASMAIFDAVQEREMLQAAWYSLLVSVVAMLALVVAQKSQPRGRGAGQ